MRTRLVVFLLTTFVPTLALGQSLSPCGSLDNAEGPFDYRTAPPKILHLVERYHFTESVATLTKGSTDTNIAGDIAYTLKWFPNHPRALMAMADLARREGRTQAIGSPYTVECWFERAIRFRPDDAQVRTIYGIESLRSGRRQQAIEQLTKAIVLAPDDANAHYNLGLAYLEDKQYDKARAEARSAYALGFPLPGLREMLQKVHQWQ